jgi:pilus assembly protein CpaB
MLRIILIVAALLVAVLSGWMVQRYLAQQRVASGIPVLPPVRTSEVLISTAKIPIAGVVNRRSLAWQTWPAETLNPSYITRDKRPGALEELSDSAARQPLFAGEPLTEAKVVKRGSSGFLAAVLAEGRRAITLKIDDSIGLGGLVQPGDRVDVILAHKVMSDAGESGAGFRRAIGETIVHDIRVLAIDQVFNTDEKGTTKIGKTITLEVTSQQAEAIFLSRQMGVISLALRSAFGGEEERAQAFTSDQDISGALRSERYKGTRILVAVRSLPSHTLLSDRDVTWQVWSNDASPDVHFVEGRDDLRRLRGSLLVSGINAGEPLTQSNLLRPSDARFVPLALQNGLRAVSIGIAPQTAVSGFITPGDRVDVLFTSALADRSERPTLPQRNFSERVVENIRVLSVEVSVNQQTGLPQAGGTATLEVSPRQAEILAVAGAMGHLSLALRPANEPSASLSATTDAGSGSEPGPAGAAITITLPAPTVSPSAPPLSEADTESGKGTDAAPSVVSFVRELDFSDAIRSIVGKDRNAQSTPAVIKPAQPASRSLTIYRANQSEQVTVRR